MMGANDPLNQPIDTLLVDASSLPILPLMATYEALQYAIDHNLPDAWSRDPRSPCV